jgi:hypothetical protein
MKWEGICVVKNQNRLGIDLLVKPFSAGVVRELTLLKDKSRLGKTGAEWAMPKKA